MTSDEATRKIMEMLYHEQYLNAKRVKALIDDCVKSALDEYAGNDRPTLTDDERCYKENAK